MTGRRGKRARRARWQRWSDDELLDLRLCDLGLTIEGTWLEDMTARVVAELARRDILLTPHFWLSSEFFSPAGVPGVAIPFYLAHPRLMRLERKQMLEVEGGTAASCLKILRHEVGHAVQHAYQVQRKRAWQRLFGCSSAPYPDTYQPRPRSRRYVQHLDYWYAQSHPDEDWAETFAVWLTPGSKWRERYQGWPALKKLEYVHEVMTGLAGQRPLVRNHRTVEPLERLRITLREHYAQKRERYALEYPDVYDRDLRRIFSDDPKYRHHETAASFLRRNRKEIRQLVARWTSEYELTLDRVLHDMIGRCRQLKLRTTMSERQTKLDFVVLLTMQTMNYLYSGRHVHAL